MKQHYIPQCYLRRFSNNERSIYTYDKMLSKSYTAPLMSVCCEDDLYSISDEFIKKSQSEGKTNINRLSIEHNFFANDVEPLFSNILKVIDDIKNEWLAGKNHYKLQYDEKKELALHIVMQYFRHPHIKKNAVDNYLRLERAEIDMVKEMLSAKTGRDEYRNMDIDVTCEPPVLHANLTYMNDEVLMDCAEAIASNIFVFWISHGNDFYMSDFPIIISPHIPDAQSCYMGLSQKGGELTIPLSSDLVLSIYDVDYFNKIKDRDGCFIEASDKEIRRQNYLRYIYATRHVFSLKNDFKLIEFICKQNGKHIFMKPNHRIEIVSGIGKY